MFHWHDTTKYNVGDRVRMIPDPYIWTGSRESGKILSVHEGIYEVEWDDGTVSSLTQAYMDIKMQLAGAEVGGEGVKEVGCRHEMKKYLGLSESFSYCNKCDHRENLK